MISEQFATVTANVANFDWTLKRRLIFGFFAIYLVLYHLDLLLGLPGRAVQQVLYRQPLRSLDGWIAINVLGLDPSVRNLGWDGGRDAPLYYIHVLVLVMCASVTALIWSLVDAEPSHYQSFHRWARLLVRYALAASLFTYGFAKVFLAQMAPAWMFLERLVEPFGDMSPAGLLWAFVGYSPAYQIFSGLAELVAASLLLFRRTTTLGALIASGVLLNVVMLNFSYQIGVKVASVNLLVSALFLAAPDVVKLTHLFVLNHPVVPLDSSDPVGRTRFFVFAIRAFKAVLVSLMLYNSISFSYRNALFSPPSNRPALSGLYSVESFVRDGDEHPPLLTDTTRWRNVVIGDPPTVLHVQMMDGSFRHYTAQYDSEGASVTVISDSDKNKKYVLKSSRPDDEHLVLEGAIDNHALLIRLKRIDPFSFSLLKSRFRWIGRTDIH